MLINTFCHVFALKCTTRPTLIAARSSALMAITSSGFASSTAKSGTSRTTSSSRSLSRHPALNLILLPPPHDSPYVPTLSHTYIAQPATRFASS
ncbi:hypothetical protein NL676_019092 [Syzygium grande]|nr:hypothetical protein NL676_019092 [Syzygium grande]